MSNLIEVELGKVNNTVDGINNEDDKIEFLDEYKIDENKYEGGNDVCSFNSDEDSILLNKFENKVSLKLYIFS